MRGNTIALNFTAYSLKLCEIMRRKICTSRFANSAPLMMIGKGTTPHFHSLRPGHCAVPQYARVCHRAPPPASRVTANAAAAPVNRVTAAAPMSRAADISATGSATTCLSTTPPYENLAFHKVTINVPDKNGGGGGGAGVEADRQRQVQRNPPLRKSKVPLKYQGIKRVKSRGREEGGEHPEKTGYSQKEKTTFDLLGY